VITSFICAAAVDAEALVSIITKVIDLFHAMPSIER
jgi:hypothetical protein